MLDSQNFWTTCRLPAAVTLKRFSGAGREAWPVKTACPRGATKTGASLISGPSQALDPALLAQLEATEGTDPCGHSQLPFC